MPKYKWLWHVLTYSMQFKTSEDAEEESESTEAVSPGSSGCINCTEPWSA